MLTAITKPHTYRQICSCDVDLLRQKVLALSEAAWDSENAHKENKFAVFHSTRHIIARFIPSNNNPLEFYSTPFWSVWRPLLEPILHQVSGHYGMVKPEFPKVMLARLKAGAVIDKHVDGAGSNLVTHKIHVPLVTNSGVWFEVGDARFQLETDIAYELNNVRPHGVVNHGNADRIHLIFEIADFAG